MFWTISFALLQAFLLAWGLDVLSLEYFLFQLLTELFGVLVNMAGYLCLVLISVLFVTKHHRY